MNILSNIARWAVPLSFLLICIGLPTSPAILSIGFISLAVVGWGALFHKIFKNGIKEFSIWFKFPQLIWIFWFFLLVISLLYTENITLGLEEIKIKLPLIAAFPAFYLFSDKFNSNQKFKFLPLKIYLLTVLIVSIATMINYFLNFDSINQSILASKAVPIITLSKNFSHIYYGFIASLAIFIGFFLFKNEQRKKYNWIWMLISIFLILCLHIISARTGLVTLYIAFLSIFILKIWKHRSWKLFVLGVLFFSTSTLGSYYFLPSIRNRVENTVNDLNAYYQNDDLSNWSISRRIAVWQTAYHVFLNNITIGTAPGDAKEEVLKQYEVENFKIKPEDRIEDPHNQILDLCVSLGIPGLIIAIAIISFSISYFIKNPNNELYLLFFVITFATFFFESILERQIGISFYVFFTLFLTSKNLMGEK